MILSTSLLLLGWALLSRTGISFSEPESKRNKSTLGETVSNLFSFGKESAPPNTPQEEPTEQKTPFSKTEPSLPMPITLSTAGGDSRYMMRGHNSATFFTPKGMSMSLLKPKQNAQDEGTPLPSMESENAINQSDDPDGWAIHWELIGANEVDPVAQGELPGTVNIYGSGEERTNLTTYSEVRYEEVYEGIDLTMESVNRGVKYTLEVAPGSDPSVIRMTYRGAESIQKNGAGNGLIITTGLGDIEENELYVYQLDEEGNHSQINAWYSDIRPGSGELSWEYKIQVGDYNPDVPLIIDPTVTWDTYLGGAQGYNADSHAQGIVVDGSGNVFISGKTTCTDFTGTVTGSWGGGTYDAIVAKIDTTGGTGGWVTYIGGSGSDYAEDLALSGSEIIVLGYTGSNNTLGTLVNTLGNPVAPEQTFNGGSYDAFVVKLSSTGTASASTYFGGTSSEYARAVAVDNSGNIYITGYTYSSSITYGSSTASTTNTPGIFLAKLENDLNTNNAWVGIHDGSDYDAANDIAVKADGSSIAITGFTKSTSGFTSGTGAAYTTHGGGNYDSFAGVWTGSGTSYATNWVTYLGGDASYEYGRGIKIDSAGNIIVMGYTNSTDFPTVNALQGTLSGSYDLFVTKFAPAGGTPTFSTYLGGGSSDYGYDMALQSDGDIVLTGSTYSSSTVTTPFPTGTTAGYQATSNSSHDGFITIVDSSASAIKTTTYYGGDSYDYPYAVFVDGSDNIYIAGRTKSSDLPGASNTITGVYDTFIAGLNDSATTLSTAVYAGGSTGGSTPEQGESITADDAGNVYVCGFTSATDFVSAQTTNSTGAFSVYGGDKYDGWVTKLTSSGALDWVTYLGGQGADQANAVVASSGNSPYLFVTGYTGTKTPAFITNYPPTPAVGILPPWQTTHQGGTYDGFLTKMKPDGGIVWSIFVGGSSSDYLYDVALDSDDNPHVGGRTYSTNLTGGNYTIQSSDIFITKVLKDDATPAFTYVHKGDDYDTLYELAVDGSGNIYATGYTGSAITFTAGSTVAQATFQGGSYDAWAAKVNSSGNVVWATYLGGDDTDYGYAIAEKGGDIYILGQTGSETISGATPYTWQGGGWDGFVAKYESTGALAFFTYFGGTSLDYPKDIALYNGNAFLTGYTYSSNFPNSNNSPPGSYDIFLSKMSLSTNPGTITSTDYYGGTSYDYARAIDVDTSGNILITGNTKSIDFTETSAGYSQTLSSDYDAFIIKLADSTSTTPVIAVSDTNVDFTAQVGTNPSPNTHTLTITNSGGGSFSGGWSSDITYATGQTTGWVSLNPSSSTTAPYATSGSITISSTTLTADTYNAKIKIYETNVSTNFVVVNVDLEITSTPPTTSFTLTPTTLDFFAEEGGVNPGSKNLSLKNTGTTSLDWSSTIQGSWTSLNSTAVTMAPSVAATPLASLSEETLIVSVDTTGLTEGSYSGTITVTSSTGENQTVSVLVTITAPTGGTGSGTQSAPGEDDKNPVSCFGASTGLSGNSLLPLALAFLGLALLFTTRRNI